ncbi:hypothetical protein [Porphyromonas circumdentaria]|uniref:hypothetical protein n=1 Tax=Porphyromonas circumdentaria TaxID=29524 RepID=UPI0026DB748A|nr:hypothetical protein [Porphyromonas circumdentaria]MDO4722985.1 hypothetical protein [Porphyromonas circumdentaria]
MIRVYVALNKRDVFILLAFLLLIFIGYLFFRSQKTSGDFEITDELGGNLFPSSIISLATTDELIITPSHTPYVGNPKVGISIKMEARRNNAQIRIEIAETPFSYHSVSEFVLPQKGLTYTIYPEIVWKYDVLRGTQQPTPMSIVATVITDNLASTLKVRTFSMRSINECMYGYYRINEKRQRQFVNTPIFFAAYVNEDSPLIDKVLREALNTRIVNRFSGYQSDSSAVVRQVYALWNVLQRRQFRYSSISNSSLGSNVVYAQRVRSLEDALSTSQINCVDGSVLFASLLRAINIDPILVLKPGHMFVGFYTDKRHENKLFLETSMIGNIDFDDYFPDEAIDSLVTGKSQNEMSKITFHKSIQYASSKYAADSLMIMEEQPGYMFLELSDKVRSKIQSIGR